MKKLTGIYRLCLVILISGIGFSGYCQADDGIVIDPKLIRKPSVSLSRFASDIQYIKLETTPECLINTQGPVRATLLDSIIIVKAYMTSTILVFDREGKFLRRIGKRGKGPEEYSSMSSVSIDTISKSVFLFDERKKMIIEYDFNGNYLNAIELKGIEKVRSISLFGDNILYKYYGPDYHGFKIIDKKGVLIKDIDLGIRGSNSLDRSFDSFSVSDGMTFFRPFPFKEFYSIDENYKVTKKKGVSFTKGQMPDQYFETDKSYFENQRLYNSVLMVRQYGNYYVFVTQMKNSGKWVLYSVDEGWYTYMKGNGIENDIDNGLIFRRFGQFNSNTMYSFIEPVDILEHYRSEEFQNNKVRFPGKSGNFEKIAESVDLDDNPVMMLVTLK